MAKLTVGNIYTILSCCDTKVLDLFKESMRYQNEFFRRKASNFRIPEHTYMISNKGVFYTGLLNLAVKILKEHEIDFEIEDSRPFTKHPDPETAITTFLDMPLKPRDYQLEAFVKGLKRVRGIFDLPTSAGKTVIIGGLIKAWGLKTLVLLKSKDLANQIRQELSEMYNIPKSEIGYIGSGIYKPKHITVGLVGSLSSTKSSDLDKIKEVEKYLKSVEAIFVDEVHNAKSASYKKVFDNTPKATVRFGFSATPEGSKIKVQAGEDKVSTDIILHSYVGPKIFKISTKDLASKGYLSIPKIVMVNNDIKCDDIMLDFDEEYDRFIVKSKIRNKIICDIVHAHYINGDSVIGFVVNISHGKSLARKLINEYNIPKDHFRFVHGNSSDREESLKDFKDGKLPILFGTVLNEGLNFMPNVGINISGNESEKYAKQRLGRILRKPKDLSTGDVDLDKINRVTYYDFADNGHFIFSRHSCERYDTYRNEGHEIIHAPTENIAAFIQKEREVKDGSQD